MRRYTTLVGIEIRKFFFFEETAGPTGWARGRLITRSKA
jgi:hypothetical protein